MRHALDACVSRASGCRRGFGVNFPFLIKTACGQRGADGFCVDEIPLDSQPTRIASLVHGPVGLCPERWTTASAPAGPSFCRAAYLL